MELVNKLKRAIYTESEWKVLRLWFGAIGILLNLKLGGKKKKIPSELSRTLDQHLALATVECVRHPHIFSAWPKLNRTKLYYQMYIKN